MKTLFLFFTLAFTLAANAGDFSTYQATIWNNKTDQQNTAVGINCTMDTASRLEVYKKYGYTKDDYSLIGGMVLKDMPVGTQLFLNDLLIVTVASDYHFFDVHSDEYTAAIVRPDGTKLIFQFWKDPNDLCVLSWNNVAQALGLTTKSIRSDL